MTRAEKLARLRERLRALGKVAVAFSGGVDSTFLCAVAKQELGDDVLAVTATSPTYPTRELEDARAWAKRLGIRHEIVVSREMELPGFLDNPPNRCYFCKQELLALVGKAARRYGMAAVLEGTNADDLSDFRPGRRAVTEAGALSPLLEAGLTKDDIRALSKEMGLPSADKPSFACLASRFPYGARITPEKLTAVDRVEEGLRRLGFRQVRVRHHGDLARMEVEPSEIPRLCEPEIRQAAVQLAKDAGFVYVAVDMEGYRTGSMNATLADADRKGKET